MGTVDVPSNNKVVDRHQTLKRGEAIMGFRKLLFALFARNGPPIEDSTSLRIDAMFQEDDRHLVREMIVESINWRMPGWRHSTLLDIERIRFAVLKLADGDVNKLGEVIELAKLDFRDVLLAANFPTPHSHQKWMPKPKAE
jgi:hypothetical protein